MEYKILDGKATAAAIRAEIKQEVEEILKKGGRRPSLTAILVGDNPASCTYVANKEKACADIGIYSDDNRLPADCPESELLALIDKLNNDPKIDGILVQLPLPNIQPWPCVSPVRMELMYGSTVRRKISRRMAARISGLSLSWNHQSTVDRSDARSEANKSA